MSGEARGIILKGVGGLYSVYSEGRQYECRLRGSIRLGGISPVTGDEVFLSVTDEHAGTAVIDRVAPRRNSLVRPKTANVDRIALVIAAASPAPDLLLTDKLLVTAINAGVEPVLVINKADQDENAARGIALQYKEAVSCHIISASGGDTASMASFFACIDGMTTVLAGQSGVGKSTILNILTDGAFMSTGSISEKTLRGRHTTRHAELFPVSGKYVSKPSFVIDSPGFSLLELGGMEPRHLPGCYPEVYNYRGECRFQDCSHTGEPGCFVTGLVEKGLFPRPRYERYVKLYRELEEKEKNRYRNRKG